MKKIVSSSCLALALLAIGHVTTATARAQCTNCVGDQNADGEVTVNELIVAVNNALVGCPGQNTHTSPPSTSTPPSTPTPTATATVAAACPITTPAAWSAPEWTTTAAQALALRAQLDTLVGTSAMRGAEQGTVVLGGVQQLLDLFHAGSPSLADVTTPTYDGVVDRAFEEFVALIAAGVADPIDAEGNWTPGPNGGIFGGSARGIDAGGFEVRQIVDKGLFAGGGLYNYALSLTAGEITPATIDAIAAAWGANQNLDRAGTLTDSANYSNQMGFHTAIATALAAAKAYAAEPLCGAQRDEALVSAFHKWEQSMLARMLYYANVAVNAFTTGVDDNAIIAGLHELSEGTGLAVGFDGVEDPASGPLAGRATVITSADIAEITTAFGIDMNDLNASTTGEFIEDPQGFASAVVLVEGVVARVYGLSAADIASYRTPTAN